MSPSSISISVVFLSSYLNGSMLMGVELDVVECCHVEAEELDSVVRYGVGKIVDACEVCMAEMQTGYVYDQHS